ncbi:MAG: hypothetical protein P1U56_05555 [Saprospiraceae bacterium]|nr:hypothetical protein [Saprospiraceae bacterium]
MEHTYSSTNSTKYGLPILKAKVYASDPNRYELVSGSISKAPLCPFGNNFKWIVLDRETKVYMRATKSVFKRLLDKKTNDC